MEEAQNEHGNSAAGEEEEPVIGSDWTPLPLPNPAPRPLPNHLAPRRPAPSPRPNPAPRPRPNPAPRRPLKRPLPSDLLESLPSANMYEKSYMHGDVVTHVAVSAAQVFITGSADGHIKFWKKKGTGIEFAKHYKSHLGPIEGLAVSVDGMLCCTISNDRSVTIYDVVNCYMRATISLPFVAGCAEWVYKEGKAKLAISDRESPYVHIYDALSGSKASNASGKIHQGPIKSMKYNPEYDTVISGDDKGVIEYWIPDTFEFPKTVVDFTDKRNTSLLAIQRCNTAVSSIEVSPNGKLFSVTCPDRNIRVFCFQDGTMIRFFDESLYVAQYFQGKFGIPEYKLKDIEFKRRMAVEEELQKAENAPLPNAIFDESSNFLIYATHLGIKVEELHDRKYSGLLGMLEKDVRFLRIALYQSERSRNKFRKVTGEATNVNESKSLPDPTLLCCAFKKHRIYLFSRREPEDASNGEGRDCAEECI